MFNVFFDVHKLTVDMAKRAGLVSLTVLPLFIFMSGRSLAQPKPADAIRATIAAFNRVNLVGLGERHGNLEDSQFRLNLVRDPEFSRKVNDIVIEFGNPLYQTVLDKFVVGEAVPNEELKKVWQQTTQQSGVWNSPVYEEFITAVRAVNLGLPVNQRLRMIAGDYPIDHTAIPAVGSRIDRDASAAMIIRREVLDRNRKALVIFGSFHLLRRRPDFLPPVFQPSGTLVNLLKDDVRAKWFVIAPASGPNLPDAFTAIRAGSAKPVLVAANKIIGELDAAALGWEDKPNKRTAKQFVDAFLYFGREPHRVVHLR